MISQIHLSREKIMLQLVQGTAVKFYLKGIQSKNRFDVSVPFNTCYAGPLLNVLLRIDQDFYGGEQHDEIRSELLFSKNFIKQIFSKIAEIGDDDNYIDQAYLTIDDDDDDVGTRINIVKKTKIERTIVNCWE